MSGRKHFDAGPDDPDDVARFAAAGDALVDVAGRVVPGWIERIVVARIVEAKGSVEASEAEAARSAGEAARRDAVPALRRLVDTDVDAQVDNPLAVLRRTTVHATRVLVAAGVSAPERDDFSQRAFPDDTYDLVPATWADIDPALADPGLTWSAAKAFMFTARRRREGRT